MEPSEASEGGLSIHPMEQFEVMPLFGGDSVALLTITNSTMWMALVLAAVSAFLILGMRGRALVPTRVQSMAEILYGFVRQMVTDVLGEDGVRLFPYIFTLFVFILFSNLLGMIPYSFAVTSHIAITGVLAVLVFCTVIVLDELMGPLTVFVPLRVLLPENVLSPLKALLPVNVLTALNVLVSD